MLKKRKSNQSAGFDQPDSLPDNLRSQAEAFPTIGTTLPNPYYGSYGGSTAAQPITQASQKKRGAKVWIKRFFLVVLTLVLLSGIFVGGKFLVNAGKSFKGSLFGLLQNNHLKGEDQGRVNILLAGNSADDPGHNGANLTDSIMIISINTRNNTAFLMSVPRDLYVDIPDHGYAKINEAYPDGQNDSFSESGYPNGGMGLLQKVVTENFGVDINYYALVDYTALKQGVDAVGGIDVTIQSTDPRGLYDPSRDWSQPKFTPLAKLSNGQHHLTGQEALDLARARGEAYGSYGFNSDYTRTANQRMMMVALKDKATSAGVALNPIRIASLLDSFGNNVQTNFKTNEVHRLFDIAKKIPSNQITSVGLNDVNGKSLLKGYTTRSGQSALVPAAGINDYSNIQNYLDTLMNPPQTPTATQSQ